MKATTENIKNLLIKSEVAYSKVENDYSGNCTNPSQLAASTRYYRNACKLALSLGWDDQQVIDLHHEVINEMR
jgi:hypothetical protein